jgi:hypothetical protein
MPTIYRKGSPVGLPSQKYSQSAAKGLSVETLLPKVFTVCSSQEQVSHRGGCRSSSGME